MPCKDASGAQRRQPVQHVTADTQICFCWDCCHFSLALPPCCGHTASDKHGVGDMHASPNTTAIWSFVTCDVGRVGLRETGASSSSAASPEPAGAKRDLAFDLTCIAHQTINHITSCNPKIDCSAAPFETARPKRDLAFEFDVPAPPSMYMMYSSKRADKP